MQLRADLYGEHAGYRARSVIHRLRSGELLALVDLPVLGRPTEWIAHEFEHVLEMIDGRDLPRLAQKQARGVWRSFDGMIETSRATDAGRSVLLETQSSDALDKFVD